MAIESAPPTKLESFAPYRQNDSTERKNYKDLIPIVATAILAGLFIAGAIYLISFTAHAVHSPLQAGDMKTIASGVFGGAGAAGIGTLIGGLSILMIRSYRKNAPLLSD